MSFITRDKQLLADNHTIVSNQFILNYLSDAPSSAVKVYLLGLALIDSGATIDDIASKLGMTNQDVADSYLYWEEIGLVTLIGKPTTQVVYMETSNNNSYLKKIKPGKYNHFSTEMQSIISGRMIGVSEYNEYYMFLENNLFQPEALLAIAKYSVDLKGNDIKHQYILAVAHSQMLRGATTLEAVAENLSGSSKHDSDIAILNKALGTSSKIDHQHREYYVKWTRELNYTLDVLTYIAKKNKKATYRKLDSLIEEYYSKGAFTAVEIDNYTTIKTQLFDIARAVTKAIGVYYQSLDAVVEEYIAPWVNYGYDIDTITNIAKYCFRNNTRTLSGVDNVLNKLYKLGLVSGSSIASYIASVVKQDKQIQHILDNCGIERNINNYDRTLYKTWTELWNCDNTLIEYASTLCVGTINGMKYLNKILSTYKQQGIVTVEQAKASQLTTTTASATTTNEKQGIINHEYTDQELNALFSDLDTIEV